MGAIISPSLGLITKNNLKTMAIKNTLRITIKIQNDLSELAEDTFRMDFDEMFRVFGDNDNLCAIINRAQNYAKAEGLDEAEIYASKEEAEFDKEDAYEDLTPTSPLNNPANFAN